MGGAGDDEARDDPVDDAAEDVHDDDDDDDEALPAEPEVPLHMGTTRVAPASDGATANVLSPPTSVLVTVRRDFPLRDGERLGEWGWSSADSSACQAPQRWAYDGEDAPSEAIELSAEDERAIIGWGIGRPRLGAPGDNAGQKTTDRGEVIAAAVRLLGEDGEVVAEGTTSGRNGACRLVTASATGVFRVEVLPEQVTHDPAGPGLSSAHELLYRPTSVRIELRDGRVVVVDDPYDPPCGRTHVRVGNRQVWTPTTTHLPLSLKPEWWKDPGSRPRRGGTAAVRMLVLHCTGGSRMGNPLNRFFARRGRGHTTAGANYILDIDGHLIKLAADDRTKVHAGVGRWGADRDIINHSFGVEIINPNTGDPNDYMARAKPPYTEEQYATLLRLCAEIVEAYPNVGPRIVGHCDVATGNARGQSGVPANTYGNKRNWDPGMHFEWERLEAAGLGMVPVPAFDAASAYDGVFATIPELRLDRGDADPRDSSQARYGGEDRPAIAASSTAIAQLQQDLAEIGYSLGTTGRFDDRTFAAADRFRRHFAREGMRGSMRGAVDRNIAERIYNVATGVRREGPPPP